MIPQFVLLSRTQTFRIPTWNTAEKQTCILVTDCAWKSTHYHNMLRNHKDSINYSQEVSCWIFSHGDAKTILCILNSSFQMLFQICNKNSEQQFWGMACLMELWSAKDPGCDTVVFSQIRFHLLTFETWKQYLLLYVFASNKSLFRND